MKKRIRLCISLLLTIILFLLLCINFVTAGDELFLTGIVKNINPKSGIATIEVKSGNCSGTRIFQTEDISELEDLQGKTISFFIDSPTCKGNEIYTMRKITLLKRGRR